MFKCGHDCLDDKSTVKQTESCIEECGQTMHKAMNLVQTEVNSFQVRIKRGQLWRSSQYSETNLLTLFRILSQGRIDRCLMDCQDSVRNERDETKARRLFDDCAGQCVKKFVPVVPEIVKSICNNLENLRKETKAF